MVGKHYSGHQLRINNGYGNWKRHWQRKRGNNLPLIMKIKENKRKGRWRDTKLHAREIRGKMKEKWDINNKKSSKKQFTTFVNSVFGNLILFSLSLILLHTWSFLGALLEDCGILWILRIRKRKSRKAQEGNEINNYNGFFLQVLNSCVISLIV